MMITCISESNAVMSETLRTLRFTMSAARIKNRPIRYLDPQEKLILELREEIKRLRFENQQLRVGITTASVGTRENIAMPDSSADFGRPHEIESFNQSRNEGPQEFRHSSAKKLDPSQSKNAVNTRKIASDNRQKRKKPENNSLRSSAPRKIRSSQTEQNQIFSQDNQSINQTPPTIYHHSEGELSTNLTELRKSNVGLLIAHYSFF
jgi:hypothetical protein